MNLQALKLSSAIPFVGGRAKQNQGLLREAHLNNHTQGRECSAMAKPLTLKSNDSLRSKNRALNVKTDRNKI